MSYAAFLQDFQAIGVNLHLPFDLHSCTFKTKIETANTCKE